MEEIKHKIYGFDMIAIFLSRERRTSSSKLFESTKEIDDDFAKFR